MTTTRPAMGDRIHLGIQGLQGLGLAMAQTEIQHRDDMMSQYSNKNKIKNIRTKINYLQDVFAFRFLSSSILVKNMFFLLK